MNREGTTLGGVCVCDDGAERPSLSSRRGVHTHAQVCA